MGDMGSGDIELVVFRAIDKLDRLGLEGVKVYWEKEELTAVEILQRCRP